MEVHAAGALPQQPSFRPVSGLKRPPVKAPEGLTPQDVPLLMSQSGLAQGQSLADLPLVDAKHPDEKACTTPAIQPAEIQQVLEAYNGHVREALENAPHGSRLDQFETSMRLMANLQDPHLQQDTGAWDVLQMRHSQVETEYKRLIQEPEVQQAFDKSRHQALQDIFGNQLEQRVKDQAAYLLNESFQHELDKLPDAEIQPRIQKELSALAVLDPKQAKTVGEELIKRTVVHQTLKALQTQGDEGAEVRAGLSQALGLYLKAQQTALGVTQQVTNFSRLVNLPDEQITELTNAISELARDAQATTPQQLALNLVSRVDELPPELRQNASTLIRHMQAQNVLGSILLAGSVAGLMRQDLPKDPKAWVSLGTATLSSATMGHFALRMVGLNEAADVAAKLNFTTKLHGINVPVVGALISGVNTTLDAMAFVDEVRNEDTAGASSRALSVGSGLATLAAITLMKGKAVPIALIGSTLTGLTAWGVDSLWGESDASGRIRQDLRALGISDKEEAVLKRLNQGEAVAELPIPDRVAAINALMDQATSTREEHQIYEILMQTPDQDFIPLMQQLHLPRLVSELEGRQELKGVLQRVVHQASDHPAAEKLYTPLLQGLVTSHRFQEMNEFLDSAEPGLKQNVSPKALQGMIDGLMKGWTRDNEKQAIARLLADAGMRPASDAMLSQGGEKLMYRLHQEMNTPDFAAQLGRMFRSKNPDIRRLAAYMYQKPEGVRSQDQTRLGKDGQAASLTLEALNGLGNEQIKDLPQELKRNLARLLQKTNQGKWLMPLLTHD